MNMGTITIVESGHGWYIFEDVDGGMWWNCCYDTFYAAVDNVLECWNYYGEFPGGTAL